MGLYLTVAAFLALLFAGMYIPFALGVAGLFFLLSTDGMRAVNALGFVSWGALSNFTLTAIPMFILMAEILLRSGVSERVYSALSHVVRRLPGGLLQTNVIGCATFAAISGSSVATAASIGTVALPQLKKRGYDMQLSTGTLAAGGTLGILIPPSLAMILYGVFTETSIAKLFMAGVLPGIMVTFLFSAYVAIRVFIKPSLAPSDAGGDTVPWTQTLSQLLPFVILIGTVLGSIYGGIATPTEAGAFGSALALVIAAIWGRLNIRVLFEALYATTRVCAALLFIILCAYIFAYALDRAGISKLISSSILGLELTKLQFLLLVCAIYLVLGCIIDSVGMIVLTVPLVYPLLAPYGLDPIWFGVVLVILVEVGQITPPVGINLFIIHGVAKGRFGDVVRGALPFVLLMLLSVAILISFPEIALYLPMQMTTN